MRPTLFRLASDTEDNDDALGQFGFKVQHWIWRRPVADLCAPCSGHLGGQRQPDAGHQSVQAAGEGRGGVKRCSGRATRCVRLFRDVAEI